MYGASWERPHSEIPKPLMDFTRKNNADSKQLNGQTFQWLKVALTTLPLLGNFSEERETVVSYDVSRHGRCGFLSQYQNDGTFRPIVYLSRWLRHTEGVF